MIHNSSRNVDLTDKVAVVTGSAKGLGADITKALAKAGARVVVHYRRSRKDVKNALAKVKEYSSESFLVAGNLTKEKEVKRIFDEIYKRVKTVDILVNLVGNFIYKLISETNFGEFKDVCESNLYPTFLCTKEVLPKMREKRYGHIINFGSVGCERILLRPKTLPYYIAKTGVYMLTKMMAHEEAKYGIRINMISPGVLPTSVVNPAMPKRLLRGGRMHSSDGVASGESSYENVKSFPAGREASFADIINAIFFLLSEKSSYIIGANIEVAGGWSPEI